VGDVGMFQSDEEKWAFGMFGHADLKDIRRNKRLVKVSADLACHVGKSLVIASGDPASIQGAYKFIENDYVDPKAIAQAGFEATARECGTRQLVLALEDTTGLSFTHSVCRDLGDCSSGNNPKAKGRSLFKHSILAMDADTEQIIGLGHQMSYVRRKLPKALKSQP
jgi:hypothetical protein